VSYGYVLDVAAPVEFYDALHAEVGRRSGGRADGLLVHVGRTTPTGFQVLEVWEDEDRWNRFNAEVVGPALAEVAATHRPDREPVFETFEVRGLVIPEHAPVFV
jgi:hypothetical protein